MPVFSIEVDAVLTAAIVVLAIVFFYLVATRLLGAHPRGHLARREMAIVRDNAERELSDLKQRLEHLQTMKTEIKKRYMKGEITSQTYATLDKENDMEIIDTQARLSTIKDASGKQ
ncbi:MAG: hypothetical protein WC792_04045 [Candidatus Micrarchaeia archaeon]|jgi:uncharacterized membrane protein